SQFTVGYLSGLRLFQVIIPFFFLPFLTNLQFKTYFRYFIIFIFIFSFFALPIITLRRGPTVAIFLGLFVYFIFIKNKIVFVKYLSLLFFVLISFYLFFNDIILSRFELRQDKFERTIDIDSTLSEEDRFREYSAVYNLISKDLYSLFFGTNELFNTRNNYGRGFYADRRLHVDFTLLAHGSGILGLSMYLFIVIYLVKIGKKLSHFNNSLFGNKLISVYYSLIFVSLFVSLSGGIESISYRCLLFMSLGGIYGTLKSYYEN
uniref:hypothetical protein n=1 Tax=Pleomorphovibrio marinus TaxID=2164132 RepID=UPI0013009BFD